MRITNYHCGAILRDAVSFFILQVIFASICNAAPEMVEKLRWDEDKSVLSPGKGWILHLASIEENDNQIGRVSLKRRSDGKEAKIAGIEREALAIWGGDERLLIINKYGADHDEIFVFDTQDIFKKGISDKLALDKALRAEILKRTRHSSDIAFFNASFKQWNGRILNLVVGGATVSKESGGVAPFCYRFESDTKTQRIIHVSVEVPSDRLAKSENCD